MNIPRRVVSLRVNVWDGRLAIVNLPGRSFFCLICDARREADELPPASPQTGPPRN